MAALSFAGKPVVLLDACSAELTFSEHPIEGVIGLARAIRPAIDVSLAESVASQIHYRIRDYLRTILVIGTRRDRNGNIRSILRAPGSPLGPLRRMQDAAERRDFRGFAKNYNLLNRPSQIEIDRIVDDELWDHRGANLVHPSLAEFRISCQRIGFFHAASLRFETDRLADVSDICLMLSIVIAALRTRGRRPLPERDLAAAEVIFQYYAFVLGDWTGPRQPSHIIGDSRRYGPPVEFLEAVEHCYGLDTPSLRLIAGSSGGAWGRVNKLVVEKMGLSGAA